jgi:hypothetical protein
MAENVLSGYWRTPMWSLTITALAHLRAVDLILGALLIDTPE